MPPRMMAPSPSSRSAAMSPLPGEPEDGEPLWNVVKRTMYRSEVTHVKKIVGEPLIQQNRLMWDELASLRQMLSDFQEQNDELSDSMQKKVLICGTQHRDLLRRQAQIILEDVKNQAESCGHVLEDMVPEIRDEQFSAFLLGTNAKASSGSNMFRPGQLHFTPPLTPSTRPSSSSGCSSTPEPGFAGGYGGGAGAPALPLGRQLGFDELKKVAEGIQEALDAEQASLLAAIGEQMERLQCEEARRVEEVNRTKSEPSTADLQKFLHKLQDLAVSPTLRTLALTGPPSPTSGLMTSPGPAKAIVSGGNVRRLQALILERRRATPPAAGNLGAVPETPSSSAGYLKDAAVMVAVAEPPLPTDAAANSGGKQEIDPFFDDPFA